MIREYTDSDRKAVAAIWYESTRRAHSFIPEHLWEEQLELVQNHYLSLAENWVYDVKGEVAGFISLLGHLIGALVVAPEYQGKGIGTELIAYACKTRESLTVDIFKENIKAREFYARRGFIFEKEHIDDVSGQVLYTMTLEDFLPGT